MQEIAIIGFEEPAQVVRRIYEKRGCRTVCFISDEPEDFPDTLDGLDVKSLQEFTESGPAVSEILVALFDYKRDAVKKELTKYPDLTSTNRIVFLSDQDIIDLSLETFPVKPESFLRTTEPVSIAFGLDRGTAIDRYYIDNYLQEECGRLTEASLILEVGDDRYSRAFFPQARHDILDYPAGMDLTKPETLPQDKYDVFICTQTLHHIYDVKKAVAGARRVLKPGGILLASVCGCTTPLYRCSEYDHYWGFTDIGFERLLREEFGSNVKVKGYGNAMAATAFLQGISLEEVDTALLDEKDSNYAVCICATAQKRA